MTDLYELLRPIVDRGCRVVHGGTTCRDIRRLAELNEKPHTFVETFRQELLARKYFCDGCRVIDALEQVGTLPPGNESTQEIQSLGGVTDREIDDVLISNMTRRENSLGPWWSCHSCFNTGDTPRTVDHTSKCPFGRLLQIVERLTGCELTK